MMTSLYLPTHKRPVCYISWTLGSRGVMETLENLLVQCLCRRVNIQWLKWRCHSNIRCPTLVLLADVWPMQTCSVGHQMPSQGCTEEYLHCMGENGINKGKKQVGKDGEIRRWGRDEGGLERRWRKEGSKEGRRWWRRWKWRVIRKRGNKERGIKRNQDGKNKERRQSHPPASVERVGQRRWVRSHAYGSC